MKGYTNADELIIRQQYLTTPYPVLARQLGKKTKALAAKIIYMGLPSKREATRPEKTTHSYRCYTSWASMIQRCTNPKSTFWYRYGGRGITVCERWLGRFANFLLDMGERPAGFSIDRINPDGNYEPCNCRWIANPEQAKTTWRYLNAKPCFVCNERRTKCGGRCNRCSQYYRRCGIERPNDVKQGRPAHTWIHNHPKKSREMGWLS